MIYRDDDISAWTDLTTLFGIQRIFDKHRKIHTVSVLLENLWESRGVWEWLMTTENIDIALHGWRHENYAEMSVNQMREDIKKCIDYWNANIARCGYKRRKFNVIYPPWNVTSKTFENICDEFGISVNTNLDPTRIFCFHWWEYIGGKNLDYLESVLRIDFHGD